MFSNTILGTGVMAISVMDLGITIGLVCMVIGAREVIYNYLIANAA